MSPERWKRIEELYQSARDKAPEARTAFVKAACQGDDDLRQEVEALLQQDQADGLLDRPAWDSEADASSGVHLAPGATLGPYRIEAYLGAGGMGSVYRAADTRLDRPVAIKLPGRQFSERFHKEARAIAALNHPHVCTLYDVGPDYLVMEYVEGQTLSDRLRKGALPLEDVLRYGAQIADALAGAHSRGIVHRDLKPANVMITASGVKLLDFGLAKISKPRPIDDSTETKTAAGSVMGTLPYMAPEQIEGQECTPRTDIFALGLTLYEMATGRRAFSGESRASLTAEILRAEPPPIASLQPSAPPFLEHIIRRCIAKDPKARWQSASDVRQELDWVPQSQPRTVESASRKRWIAPALVAFLVIATLLAVFAATNRWFHPATGYSETGRFWLTLPDALRIAEVPSSPQIAISPDGRKLAMILLDSAGVKSVWVRYFDSLSLQRIAQTEGADFPFWSPDGEFVAFFAEGTLRRVRISGGQSQTICQVSAGSGGTWSRENVIVFAVMPAFQRSLSASNLSVAPDETTMLYQVSAFGGAPTSVTTLDKAGGEVSQSWPQFLPDGEHFLYLSRNQEPAKTGTYVQRLGSEHRKFLLPNRIRTRYAPPGHLLFIRNQTLFVQPFDLKSLQLRGEPFSVADGASGNLISGDGSFDVSENGVLVYRGFTDEPRHRLVWVDPNGKQLQVVGEPGYYFEIFLSPDEKRLAVTMPLKGLDNRITSYDVQLLEFSRGLLSRVSSAPVPVVDPIWSPDSRRIVVAANQPRKSEILEVDAHSGETAVLYSDDIGPKYLDDWSSDGRFIIYHTGGKHMLLPVVGERKPKMLIQPPYVIDDVRFSPDNQWISYTSNESGRWEVYLASFPSFAQKRRISTAGGYRAFWKKDGKELFYLTLDGKLVAVDTKPGSTLETGVPKALFQTPLRNFAGTVQYAVARDGKKFLVIEPGKSDQVGVVLNWSAALR